MLSHFKQNHISLMQDDWISLLMQWSTWCVQWPPWHQYVGFLWLLNHSSPGHHPSLSYLYIKDGELCVCHEMSGLARRAFVGTVGPRCQPKAGTLAWAGCRPAYMLVYVTTHIAYYILHILSNFIFTKLYPVLSKTARFIDHTMWSDKCTAQCVFIHC